MKSKKLIPRVLAAITTIVIMLTSTPLNTLTTFANGGGSGDGQSIGSGAAGYVEGADYLNDENIGIRISLVTLKDGNPKVVRNAYGTYYFDIWDVYWSTEYKQWYSMTPSYSYVNGETRYPIGYDTDANGLAKSAAATSGNITSTNVLTFDAEVNEFYNSATNMNLTHLLQPGRTAVEGLENVCNHWLFTEAGGFSVSGRNFYNYFMETGGNIDGEDWSVYKLVMNYLYEGCTTGLNAKNTFMVVEPVMSLCNVSVENASTYDFNTTGNRYVSSWYGYLEHNINANRDPGRAHAVRNRLKRLGNDFRLGFTAFTDGAEMQAKIEEVLGVRIPTDADLYTDVKSDSTQWFGPVALTGHGKVYNDIHLISGLGIQAFWLSGTIDSGKPIDTYDIINQTPNVPTPPETPSEDNETDGTKTVIKLYCDLYKDPNSDYYTYIEDIKSNDANHPYAFVKTNTSDEVVITNEENINGYKVAGWYTSDTEYSASDKTDNAVLKASSMIVTTDLASSKSDGKTSLANLGGQQLRIDKYQPAYTSSNKAGFNLGTSGLKHFTLLPAPHGTQGIGLNASASLETKTYYEYKRLEVAGTSNYGKYNFAVNEEGDKIKLGDTDKTIVILYTRERPHISTDTTTVTDDPDDRKDNTGNLTIVKLYGVINQNTYKIVPDPSKSTVVLSGTTRNVNIKNEPGYNFAEWIYITGGAPTDLTASQMGSPNLGTFKLDTTADQAYRLDGFVDGFKNNSTLEQYFRFSNGTSLSLPTICIIPGSDNVNSNTVTGRYSYGSRSGIGTGSYNSTIYLGGDKLADNTPDDTDTNDVLYLLFLKTDQLSYSSDDLVIPESYISRYDNYKHNSMTVTGSVSNTSYEEYLQAHKFKYVLPVVTGTEYVDVNPLFIPHIALTNKTQSGLITDASSVQRLQLNTDLTHEVIKAYTNPEHSGLSDYAQLIYLDQGYAITSSAQSGKKYVGSMLNVSALNLEYTAYRNGDKVTPAIWKYNKLKSLTSSTSPLSATDTKKPLADIAVSNINAAISPLTSSNAISLTQSSRQPNDSTQSFKLNFTFSEVGDGIKSIYLQSNKHTTSNYITEFNGVNQERTFNLGDTALDLFKSSGTYGFSAYSYKDTGTRILGRAECKEYNHPIFDQYAIHSLNRLYQIKQSDGSYKYATGVTRYLNSVSDVSITQNVQYSVHYGSSKSNPYTDKTESGNGTDSTRGQYGYVRSMKGSNAITFYPYHVMQYELPESYNATLNKDGTLKSDLEIKTSSLGNNANQLYISGEEARSLNVYDYAEVSYYGHYVGSNKGVDVVNNVINTNRKGRIEISSEQWSTHARASSLIGLNNCALPGGATLSITIPAANRQTVTITSYSSLLPTESAGYSQVLAYANTNGKTAAFGTMPTDVSDATTRHNMLVESVAAGFEGLNVEQFFSDSDYDFSNTKNNGETYDAANTVYEQIKGEIPSGDNLYSVKSSKVYSVTDFTGKEDKYYYRPDGDVSFDAKGTASVIDLGKYSLAPGNNKDSAGNTGDFDTDYEDKLNTSTVTYYTFYMNRVGQVLCIKSNTTAASAKANLTGTAVGDGAVLVANWSSTNPNGFTYASGLASDIKLAAQNTGIVEQLYQQLEEGTGKDSATPWSKNNPNGEWYFEAFDGLLDRLMKFS